MNKTKATAAGLGITAIISGGIDASVLNEKPLERIETIANERVEAKQIENRVETTFPWKDQNGFKVVYDMGEPTIPERLADKRRSEVIAEVVDFGDGGFKVDILLNEKPDTNRFCYLIEGHENYDFFYQPELTKEEIEQGAERPEDIVGSYAVYHKELKNHKTGAENYATGKVMHIPHPQVWELNDEENTKEWAELSYDEKDGSLCVTVPQDFLDKAVYPVRVDPTFGYTSIGGTAIKIADHNDGNMQDTGAFTLSESGDVTKLTAYAYESTFYSNGDDSGWIYSDSAGYPYSLQGETPVSTHLTTSLGWRDFTFSSALSVSSAKYWLGISSLSGDAYIRGDTTGGEAVSMHYSYGTTFSAGSAPATFPSGHLPTTYTISIYATYTADAPPPATDTQDVFFFD